MHCNASGVRGQSEVGSMTHAFGIMMHVSWVHWLYFHYDLVWRRLLDNRRKDFLLLSTVQLTLWIDPHGLTWPGWMNIQPELWIPSASHKDGLNWFLISNLCQVCLIKTLDESRAAVFTAVPMIRAVWGSSGAGVLWFRSRHLGKSPLGAFYVS